MLKEPTVVTVAVSSTVHLPYHILYFPIFFQLPTVSKCSPLCWVVKGETYLLLIQMVSLPKSVSTLITQMDSLINFVLYPATLQERTRKCGQRMSPAISAAKGCRGDQAISHCSQAWGMEKTGTGPRELRCISKEWFQWAQTLAFYYTEKSAKFINLIYFF